MSGKRMEIHRDFHLYADLRTLAEDIEGEYLEVAYLWDILSNAKHDYWDWIDEDQIAEEFSEMIDDLYAAGQKYQRYMQELAELMPRIQAETARD